MKTKAYYVIQALKELSTDISNGIVNPNWGGCMFIAAVTAIELKKYGVEVEVVTPYRKESRRNRKVYAYPNYFSEGIRSPGKAYEYAKREKDNLNNPEIFSNYGAIYGHCGLRVRLNGKIYTWDSTGIVRASDWFSPGNKHDEGYRCHCEYPFGEGMNPHHALRVYHVDDWNNSYDPRQNSLVRAMVKDSIGRFLRGR